MPPPFLGLSFGWIVDNVIVNQKLTAAGLWHGFKGSPVAIMVEDNKRFSNRKDNMNECCFLKTRK